MTSNDFVTDRRVLSCMHRSNSEVPQATIVVLSVACENSGVRRVGAHRTLRYLKKTSRALRPHTGWDVSIDCTHGRQDLSGFLHSLPLLWLHGLSLAPLSSFFFIIGPPTPLSSLCYFSISLPLSPLPLFSLSLILSRLYPRSSLCSFLTHDLAPLSACPTRNCLITDKLSKVNTIIWLSVLPTHFIKIAYKEVE